MRNFGEWMWWLILGFILVNLVMHAKPFATAVTTVGSMVNKQANNLTLVGP